MDAKKKKMYTMLLTGCAVVLSVNYVLFPAEDVPRAAPIRVTPAGLTAPPSVSSTHKVAAIPELIFPGDLPDWPVDGSTRDPFAPPWELGDTDAASGNPLTGARMPTVSDRTGRVVFASRHHLQMLLDDKQMPLAVVDEHWLRIGDTLDQCKMMVVQDAGALFECYDGRVLLELVMPGSK